MEKDQIDMNENSWIIHVVFVVLGSVAVVATFVRAVVSTVRRDVARFHEKNTAQWYIFFDHDKDESMIVFGEWSHRGFVGIRLANFAGMGWWRKWRVFYKNDEVFLYSWDEEKNEAAKETVVPDQQTTVEGRTFTMWMANSLREALTTLGEKCPRSRLSWRTRLFFLVWNKELPRW